MDRLDEIIATLNDISTDYQTDETRPDVVAAINLLRAGAKMRALMDDGYWQMGIAKPQAAMKAWDAALGGEEMIEKWFIVSEAELKELYLCGYLDGRDGSNYRRTTVAEAACRARPVPGWATHFALFNDDAPDFTPEETETWVIQSEEIKYD